MKSEWKTVEFGEILDIPLRNGLTKPKSIRGSGCKLINMGELFKYNRISTGLDMDRVPVTLNELNNTNVKKWDLLFARQSLVLSGAGKCSIVWDDIDIAVFESHLIRARLNNDKALGLFYYYYFSSFDGKKNIESIVEQVAAAGIRGSDLVHLKVPLPPRREQKAIAATLACLDDKIELNNRINKNLEAQAQAIFKSWFVDFEPFQDGEFVDSDLGKIPKGWKVSKLDKIANFTNGLAMQKYRPKENEMFFPVLKIKELRQGKTDASSELCSANISKKYIVEDGDVVFSWSGSLMVDIWCSGKVGLNQHLFKVTSNEFNKWFYYYWICYHLNEFKAIAEAKATTMGHIKRTHLSSAMVIIPSKDNYIKMDKIMSPFIENIINNKKQNQVLSTLRDTLLPKLMSGEIQIPQEV